jgi:opacity protein-like surface antigen
MKNIFLKAIFLLLVFTSGAAFSAPDFEGFQLSAGVGSQGTNSSISESGGSASSPVSSNIGSTKFLSVLEAQYLKGITDNFLIGLGGTYNLTNANSMQSSRSLGYAGYPNSLNLTDQYAIFLQPTYVIKEGTAIYAKVNYNHARAQFNDQWYGNYQSGATNFGIRGYGFGIGLQNYLTDNIFVKFEGNYIRYQNTSATGTTTYYSPDLVNISIQTTQVQGIFSIGYKF